MLLIYDDFSGFTWAYFMRQKSDTVALFEQSLADKRLAGTPSAVEVVRLDEGGKFNGDFAQNSVRGTAFVRSSVRSRFRNADRLVEYSVQ